ncbi:hypothetical protein [Bifidobacterium sp.]|jgi:hypothetical protein|uniref:hypothetical protein n=1 Tax=Bifidobacterium sp. TaxID=41200 RepID=UPI0025B9F5AE|nr:hypothetical protein [Bifidobacterium sp.]MCI1636322.1 hypothetical protein [Bifidobacterium sp.]
MTHQTTKFSTMQRVGVSIVAIASLCMVIHGATQLPTAHAAENAATSAYGVRILDADGEVRQASAPLSQWSSGATVSNTLDSTTDFFKLNTTQSHHLSSRAASDGASTSISSGTYQLRDRPSVSFTDLTASCTRDGNAEVSFGSLEVNGENILNHDKLNSGYTYSLPDSQWYGSTTLHVAERSTDATGRVTATALRIEAEAGSSEIWRVQLGVVSCEAAPIVATPAAASGVTVTTQDGSAIIDQQPRVDNTGSASAAAIESKEHHVAASNIAVKRNSDGSAHISLDSFEQIPDTSSVGMYMWNALRVYGLALDVQADGSSNVSFTGGTAGVFVNGVWINTGTDMYTGMDSDGKPRVHVYFNERITNPDSSITINALRYEDLTGTYPSVIIGQTHWSPASTPVDPTPTPTPQPSDNSSESANSLPKMYAYALYAHGPSPLGPIAASGPVNNEAKLPSQASVDKVSDGYAGQISATTLASQVTTHQYSASLGSLELYPGTAIETTLRDISVSMKQDGSITMTTSGGKIAGNNIPAGVVAANTKIAIPNHSTTITLNAQEKQGESLMRVSGVYISDNSGLAAEVRAAVISANIPTNHSTPEPNESNGSESSSQLPNSGSPSTSTTGHGLNSGAIGLQSGAKHTSVSTARRSLASTGANLLWAITLAMCAVIVGCIGLWLRSRNKSRNI